VEDPRGAGQTRPNGRTPDGRVSPIASLIDQLGGRMPAADMRSLERLASMDNPGQGRLEFLG
jgi:hypothetical protein